MCEMNACLFVSATGAEEGCVRGEGEKATRETEAARGAEEAGTAGEEATERGESSQGQSQSNTAPPPPIHQSLRVSWEVLICYNLN